MTSERARRYAYCGVAEALAEIDRQQDEIERLRKALECVDALPPGSRGANGKFVLAKQIVQAALRPADA